MNGILIFRQKLVFSILFLELFPPPLFLPFLLLLLLGVLIVIRFY